MASEAVSTAELIAKGFLEIGDGYRAKNSELSLSGIPFARAGNIEDGFKFRNADHFPVVDLKRVGNKVSRAGDVVFTSKGTVGRFALVKSDTPRFVYSPQLCYWRSLNQDQIDSRWLYYWMQASEFLDQISYLQNQTDMAAYVSLGDQRKLSITLPPVEAQKERSAVLSALDDRIDHNRALAANLEAIARALFKSWFVDFDPVRAKAAGEAPLGLAADLAALFPDRFVNSELGEIPDGWVHCPITKIATVHSGGTPKRAIFEYWNGSIPWFSVVDAPRSGEVFVIKTSEQITQAGAANSAAKVLPTGVTIISARGTVGKIALTCGPMTINQSCYALKGTLGDFFTYFTVAASIDWLKQNVHGAVFDTITRATFDGLLVIRPRDDVTEAFDQTVRPLMQKIEACAHEVSTLTQLRELLLPRLISGKLRVEDVEATLEAA